MQWVGYNSMWHYSQAAVKVMQHHNTVWVISYSLEENKKTYYSFYVAIYIIRDQKSLKDSSNIQIIAKLRSKWVYSNMIGDTKIKNY